MFRLALPSSQLIQWASRQLARTSRGRLPSQPSPARRTLTTHTLTLSTTRPSVFPSAPRRASAASAFTPVSGTADLVPTTAISSHPALLQSQIRCGPRPTMAKTSRLIQKRRHGFLSRVRTAKGRKLIARRRAKGRLRVAVA